VTGAELAFGAVGMMVSVWVIILLFVFVIGGGFR